MNQSTVKHTEIGLRLTICSEFLLNEEKPIEELYGSWMKRVGGRLIGFTEFEYWYRRFKNNQFDLGYDTSQDSKEISEITNTMVPEAIEKKDASTMTVETETPANVVERKMEDSKLDHQFNESDVPQIFQTLIKRRSKKLKDFYVNFSENMCTIFVDTYPIYWTKKDNGWVIRYESCYDRPIRTYNPEKSIIDHLWFVLKNPNILLDFFSIHIEKSSNLMPNNQNYHPQKMDLEKMNTLLQSMFNAFDDQIEIDTTHLTCSTLNEDTWLSMLKHVKPGTIEGIEFNISWKNEGNYQRMKEIVESDQWKQAKTIYSLGVAPLKVDDVLHFEDSTLTCDMITPEDVLRITEHCFNSIQRKSYELSSRNENLDIDTIMDVLRSQNDGSTITKTNSHPLCFQFKIAKPTKCIDLHATKSCITIRSYPIY